MTKAELIDAMASGAGLTKVDAERALKAFQDAIEGAMKSGDSVTLVGFGTFSVSQRPARTGRNPQTKAPMQIPASKVVRFKAGSKLKQAVN
ncbi:MAG: HU family DNA-binding protein [bacterium]|jgi:DNA-binding protein HU-beta